MIRILSILVMLTYTQLSFSEELTVEKKQVIDEMLELTGALEVAEMMGVSLSNQMISALAKQDGSMDPKVVAVIQDEAAKIMHSEFIENRFIHQMSYKIYHKHFSLSELNELVAFYKTPTGRKMARLTPQISQEGMIAGQQHGATLGPVIERRMRARLEQEGIR